jgi:hypothetical protein
MYDELLSEDSKARIAEIARRDLEAQFKGEVSLVEVNVEVRLANDGEPYTHIAMVYDGPNVELDPKILSGFNRRNQDAFRPFVHTPIITQSYTYASEHAQIRQLIAEGHLPDANV